MTPASPKAQPGEYQLKQMLAKLVDKSHRGSALSITQQLTQISLSLAKQKSAQLLANLPQEYSKNGEQQLWKTCFYPAIETLRKANIEETRPGFVAYIDAAINFYLELIQDYEYKFDTSFQKAMFWRVENGDEDTLPQLDTAILSTEVDLAVFEGGKAKIALRSAQRHFLAVGDLHRYKALINKTDFMESKCWYIKAVQANFSNGRSFNQLAVLAVQARNYLDTVFHHVQALAAKYPFESARESLQLVFNDIRNMALSNANDINGSLNSRTAQQPPWKIHPKGRKPKSRIKAENRHEEVWIHPVNGKRDQQQGHITSRMLPGEHPTNDSGRLAPNMDVKLQRQAIIHLLHTVGILITNISMEEFSKVSNTSIQLVTGMLQSGESLATSSTLLKLTFVAIFAAYHVKKDKTTTMIETQQTYALQYLLDLLSLYLGELHKDIDNLGLYLLTGKASDKLERVLPSISTLCNWLTSASTTKLIVQLQSNAEIIGGSKVFARLAEVATRLVDMYHNNQLLKASFHFEGVEADNVGIYLPELVVGSSFHDIYPSPPVNMFISCGGPTDSSMLALHARLNSIITAADHLVTNNLYLSKREENQKTVFEVQNPLSNADTASKENKPVNGSILTNIGNSQSSQEEELDDSLLKQLVMDEEESSSQHKWILEVRPQYLIPDTNTFVDHWEGLKKIVDSKQFTVLVPTTVIAELSSLAVDATSNHSFLPADMLLSNNPQLKYVIKQAKATLEYLKRAAGEGCHNLATITSNGNILPKLSFAYEVTDCAEKKTNDDRILAACVTLADKQPRCLESHYQSQTTKIKRHVVFLTEDRALAIKAIAARIPVRAVPEFLKWSGI